MAFDRDDTDWAFDQVIEPVLSSEDLIPVRVDRQEHNDDVDDRIITEIERADLIIADLTYARPSVYFEAGVAQGRGIPVVYTARSDHLAPRADDPVGNLRVHFDLQMKNIIKWTTAGRLAFAKRLGSRVRYVLRPIRAATDEKAARAERRAEFMSRSVTNRLDALQTAILTGLGSIGFSSDLADRSSHRESPPLTRLSGTRLSVARTRVRQSLTQSEFKDLFDETLRPQFPLYLQQTRFLGSIDELWIAASLNSVPATRPEQALTMFSRGSVPHELVWQGTLFVPRGNPFGDRTVRFDNSYRRLKVGDERAERGDDGVLRMKDGSRHTMKTVPHRIVVKVFGGVDSPSDLHVDLEAYLATWDARRRRDRA